jgi:hypothetical protein
MKMKIAVKLVLAIALLGLAAYQTVTFLGRGPTEPMSYYYDLREEKLLTAPTSLIPPIPGIRGGEDDAVRAIVISVTGNPKDKSSHRIAYLEKFSPEMKRQLEAVQAGEAEPLSSAFRRQHRFVKRPDETQWHALSTPEGEMILSEWNVPGADGNYPVVVAP